MRISDWSSDVCSSDLGMFDDVSMDRLSRIMRRHIALAEPKAVLLLSDKTIRILGTADTPQARQKLHVLNHDNGTVRARSEERRVGKECVSTCRSRWVLYN